MNLKDILELAKQGYKPGDIKELIALSESVDKATEPTAQEPAEDKEAIVEQPKNATAETVQEVETVPDYKAQVEALQKQVEALQKQNTIKNIQDNNVQTDQDTVSDLVKSFM